MSMNELFVYWSRIVWALAMMLPGVLIYVMFLGLFRLIVTDDWIPLLDLPGWFRHEIRWVIPDCPFKYKKN